VAGPVEAVFANAADWLPLSRAVSLRAFMATGSVAAADCSRATVGRIVPWTSIAAVGESRAAV
jgi:hypothetical protein